MGILDEKHLITSRLESASERMRGTIDVACIFQFIIPIDQRNDFFKAVHRILSEDGQVLLTLSDKEMYNDVLTVMKAHFQDVKQFRPWGSDHDSPHSFIYCGNKISAW